MGPLEHQNVMEAVGRLCAAAPQYRGAYASPARAPRAVGFSLIQPWGRARAAVCVVRSESYSEGMSTLHIGGHVEQTNPITEAVERKATLSQFFLGDPQSYKGPVVEYAGGAAALRADAEAAGIDLYVHAPYPINVASLNNRIRIPGRKLLQQHLRAAAEIGAKGVIVHGGHLGVDEDATKGFDNWRKCIDGLDLAVPLLIENTAGGDNAMARRLEAIGRLWEAVSTASGAEQVGFCLDTCHAF